MAADNDRIRQRAYEIWEQEGRPHGSDLKHWVQAFQEIAESAGEAGAKTSRSKKTGAKVAGAAKPKAGSSKGSKAKAADSAPSASTAAPPPETAKPARGVTTH